MKQHCLRRIRVAVLFLTLRIELVAKDRDLAEGLNSLPKPYDRKRQTRTVRTCLDA